MPIIETTVLESVQTFSGTNQRGPWVKTVFTAQGGREYSTFKGDVASKANGFLGQPVNVTYSEKQNGQYTNYTLEDVASTNGSAPQQQAPAPAPEEGAQHSPGKEMKIHRQSALDRAITCFGIAGIDPLQNLDELYELSDQFIEYFNNGRTYQP